jgi:hypothetical protein
VERTISDINKCDSITAMALHRTRLLAIAGGAVIALATGSVVVATASIVLSFARSATDLQDPAQLLGVWRGTSTCTDRVAAPACQDENVVYEFTPGPQPGTVHWSADKIVNGQREHMGEFDLTYDNAETCWKAEFNGPRAKVVWRLVVDGTRLSGTGHLLPGNAMVRKIDVRRN